MPDSPTPSAYRWTPAARARFVEVLALTGSVARAAGAVGKSRGQAYKLRRRVGEREFAAAWDAAVLVAQQHIGDAMCGYALEPIEYVLVPSAANGRRYWRRVDPLLGRGRGMGLVTRLDRAAARIGADAGRRARAGQVLPDVWDSILGQLDR